MKPKQLRMDEDMEKDILNLIPGSGAEDFSSMARHVMRLGINAERERRKKIEGKSFSRKGKQ